MFQAFSGLWVRLPRTALSLHPLLSIALFSFVLYEEIEGFRHDQHQEKEGSEGVREEAEGE